MDYCDSSYDFVNISARCWRCFEFLEDWRIDTGPVTYDIFPLERFYEIHMECPCCHTMNRYTVIRPATDVIAIDERYKRD